MKFMCWVPDHGEGPEDGEVVVVNRIAQVPSDAAEQYVEERFSDLDYPRSIVVRVAYIENGKPLGEGSRDFEVTVESEPVFHAKEVK